MFRLGFAVFKYQGAAPVMNWCIAAPLRKMTLVLRPCASSAVVVIAAAVMSSAAISRPHPIAATIDTSKTGAPISKNIYGQFLEHGGDIVNNGVWSEMLVDRKFFYPVATSAPSPPPVTSNAGVQVDKTPEVQVEEQSLRSQPDVVTVRPFSVNIYSYPVQ